MSVTEGFIKSLSYPRINVDFSNERVDENIVLLSKEDRAFLAKVISGQIRVDVINGKDKTVIDYGCGTGLVGMALLDIFHPILFMDSSSNRIEEVKQKIENNHIQTAETLRCDLMEETLSGLQADYIILSLVLLHIKDTERILSKLYPLLNKGGHLLIIDFDKDESIPNENVHNGFKQAELINLIQTIGFRWERRLFIKEKKYFRVWMLLLIHLLLSYS